MLYDVVNLEDKNVVGISVKTTNEKGKCVSDIGGLWNRFIGEGVYEEINNKSGYAMGLYTDYEGDATKPYRFMCCVEAPKDANGGLESKVLKGGKYAKFTIKGHMVKDVGEVWNKIWAMDLDRAYTSDFEVYHNDSEDMNNQTIDIYISLKG